MSRYWSVLVEARKPDDEQAESLLDRLDDLMDLLADHEAAVGGDQDVYSARLTVDLPDGGSALDAALEGYHTLAEAAAKAGLPSWPITRLEAMNHDELNVELSKPTIPDLVGTAEAAEVLGVSKQRVSELAHESGSRREPPFPQPMFRLAATPVWLRAGMEGFAERWDRTPGRHRKTPREPLDGPTGQ